MAILEKCVILTVVSMSLGTMPGCLFAIDGAPISVPVYREDSVERSLPVTLIYDMEKIRSRKGGRPAGLIVYSVGFSACTPSAQSLADMLAEKGYVFALPSHHDFVRACLCLPGKTDTGVAMESDQLVFDPESQAFSDENSEKVLFSEGQLEEIFYYRNADIVSTVEFLKGSDDYEFGSLKDLPIFLVGYSLGGWNALNVAGASSFYPEMEINVTGVICQNTYVGGITEDRMKKIASPILFLTGSEDSLFPGTLQLYNWHPANSQMVEIMGADHFLFASDLCSSPILATMCPGACDGRAVEIARQVNELTVEYICEMSATHTVPRVEDLGSFGSGPFKMVE